MLVLKELQFSVVRKGYAPDEVSALINSLVSEQERMHGRIDELSEALSAQTDRCAAAESENLRLKSDCVELARAVRALRVEQKTEKIQEYERRIEELDKQLSEKENNTNNYTDVIEKMLEDVSASVQKIETEARIKAEAIGEIARREQTEAVVAKSRVRAELLKTKQMISDFLDSTEE